jgi:hypothetical protein
MPYIIDECVADNCVNVVNAFTYPCGTAELTLCEACIAKGYASYEAMLNRKRIAADARLRGVRTPCIYGTSCYRKNPKHLAKYSHAI